MNSQQYAMGYSKQAKRGRATIWNIVLIWLCGVGLAQAATLQALDFASLPGDEMRLELTLDQPVATPQVFQTDNPARIALDLPGVKSGLAKKLHPFNLGVATSVATVEAADRLRVVINLLRTVPFDTRVEGNKVLVTLKPGQQAHAQAATLSTVTRPTPVPTSPPPASPAPVGAPVISAAPPSHDAAIARLLPQQTIQNLDFRRGPRGEGRLIVTLSNPNTVVNTSEQGGKVILDFINAQIADHLLKSVDVLDFATPVQTVNIARAGSKVRITVTPAHPNYDYSSFQSEGQLIVEFRPLTQAEKEQLDKEKFPYSGERLSMNFQNIEVRSVLQILADFTELNIVASDTVSGNVSLRLNDVPWDQALDLVMKSKGLSKRQSGNVILVAPTEEISKIEKDELEAKKVTEELEPLKTEYIQIKYARAMNLRNLLMGLIGGTAARTTNDDGCTVASAEEGNQQMGGQMGMAQMGAMAVPGGSTVGPPRATWRLLSDRGTAMVDARTNTLIVRDTPTQLEEIRKLIDRLDRPVRQVMIESRIVIAQDGFLKELGVRFGGSKTAQVGGNEWMAIGGGRLPRYQDAPDKEKERGSTGTYTTANASGSGQVGEISDLLVDLAASNPYGALGMTLARGADYVLNLELSAAQGEDKVELLSNPRVMTTDRCRARILQGLEIPYRTVSQQGTQTQFKEAVLQLEVTPQITPEGSIIMALRVSRDARGPDTDAGPAIDKRQIDTMVRVENGETVVLGGVYENEAIKQLNKVPFFSDLPGIGFLFDRSLNNDIKRELLIFITPKIIRDEMTLRQ